jgi:hypothetical protein
MRAQHRLAQALVDSFVPDAVIGVAPQRYSMGLASLAGGRALDLEKDEHRPGPKVSST